MKYYLKQNLPTNISNVFLNFDFLMVSGFGTSSPYLDYNEICTLFKLCLEILTNCYVNQDCEKCLLLSQLHKMSVTKIFGFKSKTIICIFVPLLNFTIVFGVF